jgi:hypothetical protein
LDACTDFKHLVWRNPDYSAKISPTHAHPQLGAIHCREGGEMMHLARKIEQAGATGYILLWLLGIPIPILILIFLLRGCT